MRTQRHSSTAGNAIVLAMIVIIVVVTVIGVAASYTQHIGRNSLRSRATTTGMEIGDGCLETLFTNWRNINRSEGPSVLSTNFFYTTAYHPGSQPNANSQNGVVVPALIPLPPTSSFPSRSDYTVNTYQIIAVNPMLDPVSNDSTNPAAGFGPGSSQYSYYYLASVDVSVPALNGSGMVTSKVRRVFEKKFNTPWTWGVFYNDLLEITPGAALTLYGAIHTNSDLYTGSNNLTLSNLTQSGNTVLGSLGYVGSWTVGFAPGDSYHTNAPTAPTYPTGQPPAQENNFLPFGWNSSQMLNITDTNGNNDGYREIVEMPGSGADPMSSQRYYNQAYAKLIIDSTGTLKIYNSSDTLCTGSSTNTTDKQIYNTFNGALARNETFTDNREGSTVTVATLDMNKVRGDVDGGKLPNFNGIIYMSDQGASQTGGTPKRGFRVKNAQTLPTTTSNGVTPGITLATDNPLYVMGDFNTGGNSPPSDSGDPTNPTTSGYTRQPAALIADGVTVLSDHWTDSASTKALTDSSRAARNTTVNAAILAGDVPSGGGYYSGGAENMIRFLEDWTGKTFTYYGSLVEIFHSAQAIGKWGKANVYNPATQYYYYDTNLQSKSPPGNLVLASYLQQQRWYQVY